MCEAFRTNDRLTREIYPELFTPNLSELAFAGENTRQPIPRLGLLLLLKSFQKLEFNQFVCSGPQGLCVHNIHLAVLVGRRVGVLAVNWCPLQGDVMLAQKIEFPDVRFEKVKGKEELILMPLDALDEPPSLIQLRKVVAERLPRVELAEPVLEVALRTGFAEAFTHLTDRSARTADFALSLCAALLAEACKCRLGADRIDSRGVGTSRRKRAMLA